MIGIAKAELARHNARMLVEREAPFARREHRMLLGGQLCDCAVVWIAYATSACGERQRDPCGGKPAHRAAFDRGRVRRCHKSFARDRTAAWFTIAKNIGNDS